MEVRKPVQHIECFFIDRDYYVQALCDEDETVTAFSVTTRTERFAPTFEGPHRLGRRELRLFKRLTGQRWNPFFNLRLGKTRFSSLGREDWGTPQVRLSVGARTYIYSEAYYFGNPGHYQYFVFTASGVAAHAPFGDVTELMQRLPNGEWVGALLADEDSTLADPAVRELLDRFRRDTPVTTYTVLGPHLSPQNYPANFGPHGDEVRTIP